ncbi:uncharacterized protein [Drosophila kikkawai]|uniref:Uncharacterized protein n=1 Tax=Drosophila kikkawai TaxID=30033 RepID=A0A6P4JSU9_DROKI|nr:MAM and LDL-receptor class A domain-containing protein 2-like [Drosophila kikkawai]
MEFHWVLGFGLLLIYRVNPIDGVCGSGVVLENGEITVFRDAIMATFRCNRGYKLQGNSIANCDLHGRLRGQRPYCAKSGCPEQDTKEHGVVFYFELRSQILCHEGYVLMGNRVAYCDGEQWNTQLGTCIKSNHTQDHSCDFETEDQCGWYTETTFRRPWKRISTVADFHSANTGPQHDHTFRNQSGGHYMRMETQRGAFGSYHLISPIYPRALSLKTACCFRFHYFMYGEGVDSLVVSVKPVSMPMATMWNQFRTNSSKFKMTGSQGTKWLEHTITIDEMQEDFQVIFTATDARSRFGDIAIDDVKLMTGKDCGVGEFTTTTETTDATEAELVFSMMNCTGRCGQAISPERIIVFSKKGLDLGCGCDDDCTIHDNCCLDYVEECVKGIYTSSDNYGETSPTTVTIPTTIPTTDQTTIQPNIQTTTPEECKETFDVRDPCLPKPNVHSGTININKLHTFNLPLISLAVIIMWA